VSFPKIWDVYERADFLMPMLNPAEQGRGTEKNYVEYSVTGSLQTSFGFAKPMLIHSHFTESYRLDDKNSIVYDSVDDIADAMERAMNMSPTEYEAMQKNIQTLAADIYNQSMNNLRRIISGAMK
jgi:hypothetical protein